MCNVRDRQRETFFHKCNFGSRKFHQLTPKQSGRHFDSFLGGPPEIVDVRPCSCKQVEHPFKTTKKGMHGVDGSCSSPYDPSSLAQNTKP